MILFIRIDFFDEEKCLSKVTTQTKVITVDSIDKKATL